MHEREAFKALFFYGGCLSDLDHSQVSNVPSAIVNAREFAGEILELVRQNETVAA